MTVRAAHIALESVTMVSFTVVDEQAQEGQLFVSANTSDFRAVGDGLRVRVSQRGTHVGKAIRARVTER